MNKEEVLKALSKELHNGEYYSPEEIDLKGYTIEVEEDFGGEGQGDHAHSVLKVSKDGETMFAKIDGFYSSYNGTDWDQDFYEVEPYQKSVRDWRQI